MEKQSKDIDILKELGKVYAELAEDPQQNINRENWKRLNGLKPCKPMVMIDQMPWHELNINEELTLKCEDPFFRGVEGNLRAMIYKWKHLPGDMVLDKFIHIPKAFTFSGYGVDIEESISVNDKNNGVVGHSYKDLIPDEEALSRFKTPKIVFDKKETERRRELFTEIFNNIVGVRMTGHVAYSHIWDVITTFRGVSPVYLDLAMKPEFVKKIIDRFVEIHMETLDQYESEGLLEANDLIHCTGQYVEELPETYSDKERSITTKESWTYSAAQLFASVSPLMHYEFDIEPMKPIFERFGLVYYGCCEPLDDKLHYVKKIPNLRKVSISPWADPFKSAEALGSDFVMSRKPSPAVFATSTLDESRVKKELKDTLKASFDNNTNCELILKDISTVSYKPENLFRWEKIARELIES